MDAAVAIESAAANKSKSNSSNSLHKSHLNSNSSGDFSPLMSLSTSLPPSSQSSMPTTPSLMSPQKIKKSGATKVPYSKSKSYSSSKIASINNNNAQQALWSTDIDDLVNNNTIITTSDNNANNGESCFDNSSPYQTSSTPASPQCHTPLNSPLLTPPIINSSTEFTSKKGLKKSKSSILMFSMSAASRQLSNEEQSVSSNTSPKIKGQKDKKKLLNMLLSKKIKVGSNSNSRIRQQLMLNHSFDSARILPIYDMSAISAAQTATSTTTTSSTSGQTKQHHHHHHHQPLSSASHSQSAANLLSTSTTHPHQPSSISPKAASSSTASETTSTTTGSLGTSTTNSSATNSITEGANNGATTATTTITTVNPNHDSSSSSSSVTAAAPYHPPSLSNGSTNGSTSTHKQTNGSGSISGSNNNGNMSGYLFKWTNYLKGYQKRWIFLNNGFLSYYRSPNEMDHTCRGAINLANAHIQQNDDGVSFVVSNGGNQTFHLRAANDQERQKWISALETAKNKAPRPYHQGGAQQHPSSYINGIPSGKVGGGGGSSSSNAGGDLSDDDDENGAASTDAERNELESFLQVLQHKLNELSLSHEFVLKHSNMLTKSLTELENIQSKPDETAIKTINERSTIYKVAMNGVLNNCQEFINLAQFHTRKMHKILQSEHEIRLRLEDMVQEMAKQHLNIETQLSKRGKRIMAKGTPTTTNQSVSNKSQPSGGGVGGGTIKGGGQQQQATNNQQQQSAQQSSSQHQQKPSQETKSSAAASNVGAGNVNSNDEDEDETYVANDDEFHDAVEDVTQFSVTLPRGKGLHQRNPSNISKLYLQESDDDEDEYDNSENDDGRATTIKVTMHSAATSADEAKAAPATTAASSAPTATAHATDKTISNGGALVKKKPSQMDLAVTKRGPPRQRRTQITPRPNYSINLWSIMKNCIGKDLSKIPIPVNFSEPISMLQRITEELEYSQLLDQAAECEDQWEQMALVAAFTVTSYSTTATRTNKPFNPLLGETFEFDRSDDLGWRSISEQVGHHPPGFAFHAESVKDWAFYQEFTMSSKFRGQYLQVVPLGTSHLEFKKSGHHYTWRKVSTFVRNIIVGKLWIDNVGEMDIINHKTKDVCHLKYFPYSYFSREPPRKVTGIITDANNVARYVLNGTWTEQIEGAPVLNPQVVTTSSTQLTTGKSKILWKRKYPPPYLESMYYFTEFAVQLNEPEDGVAPTDSRRRPDQRLMEEARWDEANQEKLRLEEKQRTNRKAREAAAAAAAAAATANMPNSIDPPSSSSLSSSTTTTNNNDENDDEDIEKMMRRQATHKSNEPEATWFKRVIDPYTNLPIHVFKNEYWECKAKQDWSRCPDLF